MISFLDISIDTLQRSIYKNGNKIKTSSLNFNLLVYFLENPNKIISKDELKENVWSGRVVSDNTVNKQVKRLKDELLVLCHEEELLQTVYGRGMVFVSEVRVTNKSEDFFQDKNKPLIDKQAFPLVLLLLLMLLVLVFAFFQINSIKQKNVKLNQKVERLAIVYQLDNNNHNNTTNQRVIAQALKSQMLISDQLNIQVEKGLFEGNTFKQTSTNLIQDLGYNHVLNMQATTHEYGVKAMVLLRQEDYMFPLKLFEVANTYELMNEVSDWVFEQLQTGDTSVIDITEMTDSENAFKEYLTALKFDIENKPDLAIEFFQQAVEEDPDFLQAWNQLAGQYIKKGQVEKAIDVLNRIDLSQASDRLSFSVLNMRAGAYFYMGNLKLAASTQDIALEYAKKLHDPMIKIMILVNQSYIYSAMFLPDKARKNLEEALLYVDRNYQKSVLVNIYTGLFDIYNKSYDMANTLYYAELAYTNSKLTNNKRSINIALTNWGGALLMSADFDNAYKAAQTVVDSSKSDDAEVLIGSTALLLLIRMDLMYGHFKTARIKLDTLQTNLKNIKNTSLSIEYFNFEYRYYRNTENLPKAAEFLEQSRMLTLKIENLDAKIDYTMLQIDYELLIKQQNIAIEQLSVFDESVPNSPHLYVKAQVLAHNKLYKKAELSFEQSMIKYQKKGQNYILINAINAYLDFMLHQNNTSESVSNWLSKLESLSPPPYPYLKHKALFHSLIGNNNNAVAAMQKLKDTANLWWKTEDERLLLEYTKTAELIAQ